MGVEKIRFIKRVERYIAHEFVGISDRRTVG